MNASSAKRYKVFTLEDAKPAASDSDDDSDKESDIKNMPDVRLDPNLKAALSAIWDGKLAVPNDSIADKSRPSNENSDFRDLFFIDTGDHAPTNVAIAHNDQIIDDKVLVKSVPKINRLSMKESSDRNKDEIDNRLKEVMKKSVLTSDFHSQEKVLPYYQSINALKKKRKEEREKTKGKDWFDLPATELTDERRRDLEIMALRDVLDTKSFYRKDDRRVLPKYFQVGTVIEDATDFYSDRIPKKQRKQTIVDELLASSEFQKRQKAKYKEILMKKKAVAPKTLKFKKKRPKSGDRNNSISR